MPEQKLELRFDPSTIEHLGIKMYSQLPQALAELVANAYDASAGKVEIKLYDNKLNNKRIVVSDDGIGMSFDDVRDKFLIIGRKRRDKDKGRTIKTAAGLERTITGRKGLGKLALFGIGNNIKIETTSAGEKNLTDFSLNWNAILAADGVYEPITIAEAKPDAAAHGTTITLSELTRDQTFDLRWIAVSLSKMFNCIDVDFNVVLTKNDDAATQIELSRDLRYEDMEKEFEWDIAEIIANDMKDSDYAKKNELTGKIVSSLGKTMKTDMRGITLYVNGRLANKPDWFGAAAASHAFAYLSGWIDANFLDEEENDVISTDRQTISWDMPHTAELQAFLKKVVNYVAADWEKRRKDKKQQEVKNKTKIDIPAWLDTMPEDTKAELGKVVEEILGNAAVEDEKSSKTVESIHKILPEYPQYHWRNLNSGIKDVAKEKYVSKDYFESIKLALIQYVNAISARALKEGKEVPKNERSLLQKAFGCAPNSYYKIASEYKKADGNPLNPNTIDGLEEAQKTLSEGLWAGFRHPIQHDLPIDIKASGVISEQNCLDALSILSMLFDRFDSAVETPANPAKNADGGE